MCSFQIELNLTEITLEQNQPSIKQNEYHSKKTTCEGRDTDRTPRTLEAELAITADNTGS